MKAAILRALATPLVIEEIPTPEPGPGQVLIRTEACGVCESCVLRLRAFREAGAVDPIPYATP